MEKDLSIIQIQIKRNLVINILVSDKVDLNSTSIKTTSIN